MRTQGPDGEREREYDAVLVANGHHWDARWPSPAYPGAFDGQQLHSHEYRSGEQLAGRDVVVVGAGNSAMDIAVEASHRAASATLPVRRGQWVVRKTVLGIPADRIALPGWMPWWATSARLGFGALVSDGLRRYGLPRPPHAPGQSHPVQSDRIRERLAGDRVVFTDGSSVRCDLLIWATGYRVSFPFLDPALVAAPDKELPLWKRTVHPDLPGLYFLGLLQPIGAIMPLVEAQSAWIVEQLTGAYAMPDATEVRAQMLADHERSTRHFYASPRHTMEVDFDQYLWDLDRERRRGRARAAASNGAHARRVVAITGGANGIGRAIAERLVADGARVVIGDRDGDAARRTADALVERALALEVDVADAASWAAFLQAAEAACGRVDVLVQSAGVMWVGAFDDEPEAAMRRQLDVNLVGTMLAVRHAAPAMRARRAARLRRRAHGDHADGRRHAARSGHRRGRSAQAAARGCRSGGAEGDRAAALRDHRARMGRRRPPHRQRAAGSAARPDHPPHGAGPGARDGQAGEGRLRGAHRCEVGSRPGDLSESVPRHSRRSIC